MAITGPPGTQGAELPVDSVLTWWEVWQSTATSASVIWTALTARPVRAGNGFRGDPHEFLISPQDTALSAYVPARTDLSSIGGLKARQGMDGIAQEVDIETGGCSSSGTAWSTSASRSPSGAR